MKSYSILILQVCLIVSLGGSLSLSLNAQPVGPDRPLGPHGDSKAERKLQRGDKERPKPFLMASDPRFAEMLKLALVEEDQLKEAIQNWPEYAEMNAMRRRFLERRLEGFRERVRSEAMEKAGQMGLNIPEARENEFIRDYWTARIRIEKEVRELAERELKKRSDQVRQRVENKWK